MVTFDVKDKQFFGPGGALPLLDDDDVALKLAMLIVGECGDQGPVATAKEFGFSKQRYYQLKALFVTQGIKGLVSKKRGPKRNYRRLEEVVCQALRHRFLDPDASTDVIAQKLRQCGFKISKRSVDRIFAQFGLQKKTLHLST